ncbi:MAG: aepX [Rhodospirillales bacterium]|jgi:phosphoenolpyruvate phosphomutase|nr:aepX [Rhodospirillales bacterium]
MRAVKSDTTPIRPEEPTKFRQLRALLESAETEFLMEAHNGISAKIAEETGFKGIWASGLSISAALGVRDSNEASWTQVLEVLEFMADATTIPILVDGDTGYGNFNNMRRAVQKLIQRGIGGICIEDKLFPKTNSFIGEGQPLADIDEFCGKIKAGKDSQSDDDFSIVARVEALISGWGMEEALKRAEAYRKAGADAILIHSKRNDALEILQFLKEWANRAPVVIVPTTYYKTPTQEFRDAKTSVVIWANHNIRASIAAMRDVSARIQREQYLGGVEDNIATVNDIFNLAGNAELSQAEKRYLPVTKPSPRAIVLAASRGNELGGLTEHHPKCMIDIRGQPLLRRMVSTLNEEKIREIAVVRGYKKETVNLPSIDYVDNDRYMVTGEVATLACAEKFIKGDVIVSYGDILFRHYILPLLIGAEGDIVLAVDALWRERDPDPRSHVRDLVQGSRPFRTGYLDDDAVHLKGMGRELDAENVHGEWIGLAKLSAKGSDLVKAEIAAMRADASLDNADLNSMFSRLVKSGADVRILYVTGHWLDVDNAADLENAQKFL